MTNIKYNLPYTDWASWRKLGRDDARLNEIKARMYYGSLSEPTAIKTPEGEELIIDPASPQALSFEDARRYASIALFELANEKGISNAQLSQKSGTDVTLLSKIRKTVEAASKLSDIRPLSVPLINLYCLNRAASIYSLHYLLFGEAGEISLPKEEAVLARYIDKLDKEQLTKLYDYAKELKEDAVTGALRERPELRFADYIEYDEFRPLNELLRERIVELASTNDKLDNCHYAIYKSNDGVPLSIGRRILTMFYEEDSVNLTLQALMFLAQESGQAIDFFLANNYAKQNNIPIFYSVDGKAKQLRGRINRQLIGIYTSLPRSYKTKLYGEIAAASIRAKANEKE